LKIKKLLILPLVIVLYSCATTETVVVEPFNTSVTYDSDFDETWSKLVRFYSTNQIGIGTLEKDSGIITMNNDKLSVSAIQEYCADSPVPFLWTPTGGTARGNATLIEEDGFTTATVNVSFSVNSQYCYQGCNYTSNPCQSNGNFERALLTALE
jgi:hypothetical protein